MKQEADDSDEEDDRKGGMQKEDINKWLQDIENCWADLERNVDYPRYIIHPFLYFSQILFIDTLKGQKRATFTKTIRSKSCSIS